MCVRLFKLNYPILKKVSSELIFNFPQLLMYFFISIFSRCWTHPENGATVVLQRCSTHGSGVWLRLFSGDQTTKLPFALCWNATESDSNPPSLSPVHPHSRDNCRTWLGGTWSHEAFKLKESFETSSCREKTGVCQNSGGFTWRSHKWVIS